MATILKNVVVFTGLVLSTPVSLPHLLNVNGVPANQLAGLVPFVLGGAAAAGPAGPATYATPIIAGPGVTGVVNNYALPALTSGAIVLILAGAGADITGMAMVGGNVDGTIVSLFNRPDSAGDLWTSQVLGRSQPTVA